MKINKKTYLLFITSWLALSHSSSAAELTVSPYDSNLPYGPRGYYSPSPQGAPLGVYRQGNIEYLPYQDSKGATGAYMRFATYDGQQHDAGPQGAIVFLGDGNSPRMQDPAICHYNPKTRRIKAEQLLEKKSQINFAEELFKYNHLDLSDFNLSESDLAEYLSQADLSAVREINVSCSPEQATTYNAKDFLVQLFQNNTLRSLMSIDASGSNIDKATLELLRTKTDLREPLIRDMWKLDETSGKKVASIEIDVRDTPIATLETVEKRQLQVPGESRFSILYRSSDYFPGSAAHLQLFLK